MVPVLGPMCPSEAFGHAAFMLAGTAFLEPDILYLRAISIVAGGATLVFTYFHPTGRPLWLPFGWNVVFMLINVTQIYRILQDCSEAKKLPPQALELWRSVFAAHGLSDVEFSKLLAAGTWTTFRKGTTLQEEGQPSNSVFIIVHGGADVLVRGEKAHNPTSLVPNPILHHPKPEPQCPTPPTCFDPTLHSPNSNSTVSRTLIQPQDQPQARPRL